MERKSQDIQDISFVGDHVEGLGASHGLETLPEESKAPMELREPGANPVVTPVPSEDQGLTYGPLKNYPTTVKAVWNTAKPVLRVVTMPWWWPVGYLVKTVRDTPGRVKTSFMAPMKLWGQGFKLDRDNWTKWTESERVSVLRQAFLWLAGFAIALMISFSLPGVWKILPVGLICTAWWSRWEFDVVRHILGLPQVVKANRGGAPEADTSGIAPEAK